MNTVATSSTPTAPATAPRLHIGTFTVVRQSDGKRATIRIRERMFSSNVTGYELKIVAEYLRGPDNERDYTAFAFVDLKGGKIRLWSKFWKSEGLREAARVLEGDPQACARNYALRSGRCSRCGRTLTTPESVVLGYGPECWAAVCGGR